MLFERGSSLSGGVTSPEKMPDSGGCSAVLHRVGRHACQGPRPRLKEQPSKGQAHAAIAGASGCETIRKARGLRLESSGLPGWFFRAEEPIAPGLPHSAEEPAGDNVLG